MARAKAREKFSQRKIYETFLDFAAPLLEPLGEQATSQEMENALQLAFTVWNAVEFDAVDHSSRWVDQLRNYLAGQDPRVQVLVEQLVVRKQTLFGNDHRLIGKYELYSQQGEPRLRAEARQARPTAGINLPAPSKRPR